MTQWAKAIATILLALCAVGCRIGGSDSVENVLNELRAENAELRKELDDLKQQNAELAAKSAAAPTAPDSIKTLSAEELQALPRSAKITLDSLSGIVPRTSQLYLYIKPLDGKSRFVQVVGRLSLKISRGSETLIERTLAPVALREAFRSGLGGTYYLIDCGTKSAAEIAGAVMEVQFDDALTGATQRVSATFDENGRVDLESK